MEDSKLEKVKYLIREFEGGNRASFARKTGIDEANVSRIVNGKSAIGNITAGKIVSAYGLPFDFFSDAVPIPKTDAERVKELERVVEVLGSVIAAQDRRIDRLAKRIKELMQAQYRNEN